MSSTTDKTKQTPWLESASELGTTTDCVQKYLTNLILCFSSFTGRPISNSVKML
jgi:hypothetical protein